MRDVAAVPGLWIPLTKFDQLGEGRIPTMHGNILSGKTSQEALQSIRKSKSAIHDLGITVRAASRDQRLRCRGRRAHLLGDGGPAAWRGAERPPPPVGIMRMIGVALGGTPRPEDPDMATRDPGGAVAIPHREPLREGEGARQGHGPWQAT